MKTFGYERIENWQAGAGEQSRAHAAGIRGILIEELGRKERAIKDIPGGGVPRVIERDVIGVHPNRVFVANRDVVRKNRVHAMGEDKVRVIIVRVLQVINQAVVVEIEPLIAARDPNTKIRREL